MPPYLNILMNKRENVCFLNKIYDHLNNFKCTHLGLILRVNFKVSVDGV